MKYTTFHFFNAVYFLHRFREGISGEGVRAEASMFLYRTSNYSEVYPAGQVTLPVGSPLYVGVTLDQQHRSVVVVLENCYASNTPNPNHPAQQYLIQNKCVPRFVLCHRKRQTVIVISVYSGRCPTDQRRVVVTESGLSQRARFSALLFLLQDQYSNMYLHCSLSLCDQRASVCVPVSHI